MSYNNDEQSRRAQAARNAQWASNSSQPQNLAPYQTGGYANLNEPTIHTTGTVPMNLLNSPSSHSVIPDIPHNPAPLPLTYQSPIRQQESHRTVLENTAYDQGGSSRGPPSVGYGAQPRSYYGQAPRNPGLEPGGSSQRPSGVGFSAQHPNYYSQPAESYTQPTGSYAQAPPNPVPGPSDSQSVQANPSGSSTYPSKSKQAEYDRKSYAKKKAKKASEGTCLSCDQPRKEGYVRCEKCLKHDREQQKKSRDEAIAQGKCYVCKNTPVLVRGGKCEKCMEYDREQHRKPRERRQ
ncbi:uncharacterized protein FSUBG_3764 [Fusarium subglutinans]|uniref:Uncharacterized protein n=1 Tax=Gibberella subglutinans TaxID=42677 RepID=A0A8H5V3N0_GIBSU|nr:uncharacterized protein FSUBG_3764 [Fusarium subglutinans]KAF5609767.1 hypothetical protein FSUBG_3764 [Fusarium subglutinans]